MSNENEMELTQVDKKRANRDEELWCSLVGIRNRLLPVMDEEAFGDCVDAAVSRVNRKAKDVPKAVRDILTRRELLVVVAGKRTGEIKRAMGNNPELHKSVVQQARTRLNPRCDEACSGNWFDPESWEFESVPAGDVCLGVMVKCMEAQERGLARGGMTPEDAAGHIVTERNQGREGSGRI